MLLVLARNGAPLTARQLSEMCGRNHENGRASILRMMRPLLDHGLVSKSFIGRHVSVYALNISLDLAE